MTVFRIALAAYGATSRQVFGGLSGYRVDGRWHHRGRYLDYAASSRSLAVLERLVHYKRFDHLQAHVLCHLELPEAAVVELPRVPEDWAAIGLSAEAQALGDDWCDRQQSPALRVPSVVTPGESNFLINSRHPDWRWDWVSSPEPLAFDARLRELMESARRR